MRYQPVPQTIWNQMDEFGLLIGLGHWSEENSLEYIRYPGESNKRLKYRSYRAAKYPGDSTKQGLMNTISRDLGISVSGADLYPWYQVDTKKIFFLSELPYPGSGNVRVYVSSSGSWTDENQISQQIRASGYSDAVSGWILWNLTDVDPSKLNSGMAGTFAYYNNINATGMFDSSISYGNYTPILEFVGSSVPNTDDSVKVEYLVNNGTDDFGLPILNWRSDFSHPDDYTDLRFIGRKSALPELTYDSWISGHVAVWGLSDISRAEISGHFFDASGRPTAKLVEIKDLVAKNNPLRWGEFRYDLGTWDQLDYASYGAIPSFTDETNPSGNATIKFYDGSKFGTDLYMADIDVTASGLRSSWWPKFNPGEFYFKDRRFYLFAHQMSEKVSFTSVDASFSGLITASGTDAPTEMDVIILLHSGRYYNDYEVPNNPYFRPIHDFKNPQSGIYYRIGYVDKGVPYTTSEPWAADAKSFYYDYDKKQVWASGVDASADYYLVWENQGVGLSGSLVAYSGGYGLGNGPDLNPLNGPFNKVFYLGRV